MKIEDFKKKLIEYFYEAPPAPSPQPPEQHSKNDFLNYGKFEEVVREEEKNEEPKHEHPPHMGCYSSHSKENEIYQKSNKEKFESIEFFKEKGNESFLAKDYQKAQFFYQQAIIYLTYLIPTEKEDQRYEDLFLKVHLNMATVQMETQQIRTALSEHIYQVLSRDPTNAKGLYKKAKAYYLLDEFENCAEVLKRLVELEPRNKEVLEL